MTAHHNNSYGGEGEKKECEICRYRSLAMIVAYLRTAFTISFTRYQLNVYYAVHNMVGSVM
jgi:hypothetical protein